MQKLYSLQNRKLVIAIIVIVAGLIAYSNTFNGAFLYDDYPQILLNEDVQELSSFSDLSVWTSVNYRPLSKFTLALNWAAGGKDPLGFHIVNFILHLLATFMVFLLSRYTLRRLPDDQYDSRMTGLASLFITLLFLLHPLQTMAVTYIVQRMTVMAALFYILAVFLYARGRNEYLLYGNKKRSILFLSGAFLAGILAVLSKQNAATFPVAFLLYEFFFIRTADGKQCKKYIGLIAASLGLAFIAVLAGGFLPSETDEMGRLEYFIGQFGILPRYLGLLILPIGQNVDHYILLNDPLIGTMELVGIGLLAVMLFAAIYLLKRNRLISFGIFWFLITMSVESGLVPIRDLMMEHRMYLPIFGIGMIVAGVLMKYAGYRRRNMAWIMVVVVSLLMIAGTYNRNKVWQTEMSLWTDSLEKYPDNPRAMINLGVAINNKAKNIKAPDIRRQEILRANGYFSRALSGGTFYSKAHLLRGQNLILLEEYDAAYRDILKVVPGKPRYAYMQHYLEGVIHARKGAYAEALSCFDRGLKTNQEYAELYKWRGLVQTELRQFGAAIADFKKAQELNPGLVILFVNISELYYQLGEYEQSLDWIKKAQSAGVAVDSRYLGMLEGLIREK